MISKISKEELIKLNEKYNAFTTIYTQKYRQNGIDNSIFNATFKKNNNQLDENNPPNISNLKKFYEDMINSLKKTSGVWKELQWRIKDKDTFFYYLLQIINKYEKIEQNSKQLVQGLETSLKGFLKPTEDKSNKLVQGLETSLKGFLKPTEDNSKKLVQGIINNLGKILKNKPVSINSKTTEQKTFEKGEIQEQYMEPQQKQMDSQKMEPQQKQMDSQKMDDIKKTMDSQKMDDIKKTMDSQKMMDDIQKTIDSLIDMEITETTKYANGIIQTNKSCITKYGNSDEKCMNTVSTVTKPLDNNADNNIINVFTIKIDELLSKVDKKKSVTEIIRQNKEEIKTTTDKISENIDFIKDDIKKEEIINQLKKMSNGQVTITDKEKQQKYDILVHIIKSVLDKLMSKSQ